MLSTMSGHITPGPGARTGRQDNAAQAEIRVDAPPKIHHAPGAHYAALGPLIGWDKLSELMRALDE